MFDKIYKILPLFLVICLAEPAFSVDILEDQNKLRNPVESRKENLEELKNDIKDSEKLEDGLVKLKSEIDNIKNTDDREKLSEAIDKLTLFAKDCIGYMHIFYTTSLHKDEKYSKPSFFSGQADLRN